MMFTLEAPAVDMGNLMQRLEAVVAPVQAAMAARYGEIVRGNFGASGIDRPAPWPMLSPDYARRVGRRFATLFVSGALYDSIKVDTTAATVSTSDADVPYATVHQFGGGNNIPARPYFPMNADGSATEFTRQAVTESAREELRRCL